MNLSAEERRQPAQSYPVTPESDGAAVVRDPRGWLYRLIAPSPECAVLQVGDGFAENWLADVTKADLLATTLASLSRTWFDMIAMHYSLGGLATLDAAIGSASRLIRRGGVLAIAGQNRLRPAAAKAFDANGRYPRATAWGYRSAMAKAGFCRVRVFIAHPPGSAPVYLVDAHRLSAQEFFRTALRDRHLPRWSPMQLIVKGVVKLNLMPHFESGFLVVGEKC